MTSDPALVAERRQAIAELMARVDASRWKLRDRIARGEVDQEDAHRRNASMPGVLGERWAQFMALTRAEQVTALEQAQFNGMAWQSLLQCSPFF
ncbi:hypothetical protein [Ottowia oryzae]